MHMRENKKRKKLFNVIFFILILLFCIFLYGLYAVSDRKIVLHSNRHMTIEVNETFIDPGATATDGCRVKKYGSVDTSKIGTYTLTYKTGSFLWSPSVKREVTVIDSAPPEITLKGESEMTIDAGTEYIEQGATAYDSKDKDVNESLQIDGAVNIYSAGTYPITYTACDKSGNASSVTRTVTVKETENEAQGKTIYLTFDNGPGKYTEALLNILDEYGVKATFFVTNQNPDYNYMIREIAERGHSIGIHTYSHDYKDIYSSVSAYFNDLERMQQIIKEQAGFTTSLVRFPGGSSNTISKCYSFGIMTELASELNKKNMKYYDWNVSSGDAGEVCTSDAVYRNVINGISGKDTAIVLQHDIKGFSVEAVGRIIEWGMDNGYTFSALHSGSPTAHHKIFN